MASSEEKETKAFRQKLKNPARKIRFTVTQVILEYCTALSPIAKMNLVQNKKPTELGGL